MKTIKRFFVVLKNRWMIFARAVGWFNTRVLLAAVYVTIIALPAIVLKIIRKDLLDRRINRASSSYWKSKPPSTHSIENAKHQF